jgi:hypothetical protein
MVNTHGEYKIQWYYCYMRVSDISGERFGKLVVVSRAGSDSFGNATWLCRCDCGGKSIVSGNQLRRTGEKATRSCGCAGLEKIANKNRARLKTHGYTVNRTPRPEYYSWASMRSRCLNPNAPNYHLYGGRGITICDRWGKFENFLSDMGPRPKGRSLDRKDNSGNYEPRNCKWSTPKEQSNNRRDPWITRRQDRLEASIKKSWRQ